MESWALGEYQMPAKGMNVYGLVFVFGFFFEDRGKVQVICELLFILLLAT